MTALKAEELRIKNLIASGDTILIVDGINASFVHCKETEKHLASDWNYEDVQPIPITEEWLLKLGFVDEGKGQFFYRPENFQIDKAFICVMFEDSGIYIHIVQYNPLDNTNSIVELEPKQYFVHHLQNIWHSITHTELTIIESNSLTVENKKG